MAWFVNRFDRVHKKNSRSGGLIKLTVHQCMTASDATAVAADLSRNDKTGVYYVNPKACRNWEAENWNQKWGVTA